MLQIIERLRKFQAIAFSKYLFASAVALSVDMGLFFQLIIMKFSPMLAAAIAYSAGIIVHWMLSSRFVFIGRVASGTGARGVQQTQFVASALMGLGITTGVVAVGHYSGLDLRIAKLMAIAVSFLAVWYLRDRYVFRSPHPKSTET